MHRERRYCFPVQRMGANVLVFSEHLLNRLPPKGRAKAIMLDEERAAAGAAMKAALNDLEDAWQRRDNLERNIRNSERFVRTGTMSLAHHPLEKLREMLSRSEEAPEVHPLLVKAELEIRGRLQPRYDRASDAFQSFGVVDGIAQWLAGAAEAGVRFVDAPEVKLPAKAAPEEVKRVRSKIAEIEAAIHDTTFAPLPLADVKEAIVREISEIAAKGQPRVRYNDRRSSPLKLGEALGIRNSPAGPSTAATLVWAMQDVITERALSLVGDIEPERALTNAQRDALLEQLAAERLEAERIEEAAIMAAHAAGIAIARRREADPRAVLGIKDVSGRWRTRADVGFDDVA